MATWSSGLHVDVSGYAFMTVHFACTKCGKCCHGLKLTLSIDEALHWTRMGHPVQILIEALPWLKEAGPSDGLSQYDLDRTVPALSGSAPIRIAILLATTFEGPCPHLKPDLSCGQYERRPRICRIYPLTGRPVVEWEPGHRLCPPEAWRKDLPILVDGSQIADEGAALTIAELRQALEDDAPDLQAAVRLLGYQKAGLANEGFAVLSPKPVDLVQLLGRARLEGPAVSTVQNWTCITNRQSTAATLRAGGYKTELVSAGAEYLAGFADEF